MLDDTVDVNKGKVAREMKDIVFKNSTKTHKSLKLLNVGDLCYRRHFVGKRTVQVDSLCKVIKVCRSRELYDKRDLETERIYLRNCLWIEPSETSLNEIHKAKNLKVICDKSSSHQIDNGNLTSSRVEVPHGCLYSKDSKPASKCVKFDNTMVLVWCELKCWRSSPSSPTSKEWHWQWPQSKDLTHNGITAVSRS